MIYLQRLSIATVIFTSSLLLHAIPAAANQAIGSGQLRPVNGNTVAYTAYIDNSGNCVQPTSSGPSVIGVSATNTYVSNMQLSCPPGTTMVQWGAKNQGEIVTGLIGGGYVHANSEARCCPLKYKWAQPTTPA